MILQLQKTQNIDTLIAHKSFSSFAKPVGFMFVRFFLFVLFKILVQKAPLLLPRALHLLFFAEEVLLQVLQRTERFLDADSFHTIYLEKPFGALLFGLFAANKLSAAVKFRLLCRSYLLIAPCIPCIAYVFHLDQKLSSENLVILSEGSS